MEKEQKIIAFLMFDGKAEEAMEFYTRIFDEGDILSKHYQDNGSILHATFTVKGQQVMCIDSMVHQPFTFTPSMSLYVKCDTQNEIEALFGNLSEDGQILMPLASTPVSEKFGWVADKYGVSWQLNLEKKM